MQEITQTETQREAEREAWRARPAPTANELQDLAKRLRKLAQVLELEKPGNSFIRDDCVEILKPVNDWYSRAVALQDKHQMKVFRRVSELQGKILWPKGVAVALLVSRLGTLASEVDELEPHLLTPPKRKLAVNLAASDATLDGVIIPLNRTQATALDLLIRNNGEYSSVAIAFTKLVECTTGKASRPPSESRLDATTSTPAATATMTTKIPMTETTTTSMMTLPP